MLVFEIAGCLGRETRDIARLCVCVCTCAHMHTHERGQGRSRSAAFLVGGVESKDRAERSCQLRVRDNPGEGKDFA